MARHQQPYPTEDSDRILQPQGRGRLRDRGRRILAATATAVLLLAGVTACSDSPASTSSKSSTAPKEPFAPAQLAQAWKSPRAEGDSLRTPYMAAWRTPGALYVGRGTGVEILDLATGKKLGTVVPPEPDMTPCGMTEGLTADGLGAIAWIKGNPEALRAACDRITLIDTRNGNKIAWTKQISGAPLNGKPLTNDTTRLAFLSGDVLAVMTPNTVVGLRLDGAEAWTWRNIGVALDKYVLNWDMTAHQDRIMVMIGIEGGPELWRYWVSTLDASGKEVSKEPVPMPVPSKGDVSLVGAAPMTAIVTPYSFDKVTKPELVTFNLDGSVARRIPLASAAGEIRLNQSKRLGSAKRFNISFSGSTAYLVAGNPASSTAPIQIVALDLESGATLWTEAVDTVTIPRFLGVDKDTVYVLAGKTSQDMPVYAYAAKDGKRTQISTVKATGELLSVESLIIDYNAGSLALTEPGQGPSGTIMFRPTS